MENNFNSWGRDTPHHLYKEYNMNKFPLFKTVTATNIAGMAQAVTIVPMLLEKPSTIEAEVLKNRELKALEYSTPKQLEYKPANV